MSEFECITYTTENRVGLITLNRPDVLNAFSRQMGDELQTAMQRADADDDVRCLVVTGAGRAFCAGADFSGGGAVFGAPKDSSSFRSDPLSFHPWDMRKPTIAAVNGAAMGLGLTMTLQFDLRVMATDARLGIVQVRRGIMPDLHCHWTLPRLIGHARATELMLTGREFNGAEAADWGLANRAVPADEVLATAMAMATEIAIQTAPVSVGVVKRLLWASPTLERESADQAETDMHLHLMGGPDAREGVMAFLEKRPPEWAWTTTENWPDDLDESVGRT